MTEDRRTKAQILAELERVSADAARKAQENEELRRAQPRAPHPVPEADALAACIRALDTLNEMRRNSYSVNRDEAAAVRRTIIALCEKYGVDLTQKVVEQCERRHVEDMTAVDVLSAVKRDFEGYAFPG